MANTRLSAVVSRVCVSVCVTVLLFQVWSCWRRPAEIDWFTSSMWRRTTVWSRLWTITPPPSLLSSSPVNSDSWMASDIRMAGWGVVVLTSSELTWATSLFQVRVLMFEWWAVEQTRVSTSRQLSRSVCLFFYLKPDGGANESHCFSHGPDGRGFVILQESPRGGEDHTVWHGPGLIEDARGHCLSGPKHQVWAARSFREQRSAEAWG